MKLQETERDRVLEGRANDPSGDGWRQQAAGKRGGSLVLKLAMLAVLAAAGAWALRANLWPDRPAMDMSMRVTSGNTPFPVSIAPVERRSIAGNVVYTGSVAPFNEQDIFPRVTGRIVEMLVYPGDAVHPGQVVARLDSVELSSRVKEAEAGLASARASRAQMEADLVAAQHAVAQMEKELAMVDADLTYSRSLIARTERLYHTGAVSRQEYESDRAMAASTEAKREAALAKLEQSRASETAAKKKLEAADSTVSQTQAALRTATIVRDYVEIVAPTSGYVVKRLVAQGVLVQPGMPILKIAQIDRVRLQANVGERDVASIRVGSPVTVTTTAAGLPPITARVTSVFPFVDQGPRTAVVEAAVENTGRRFLPGQYVTMQFVTGERSAALTVPVHAVTRMGGKATVWVVKDDRAEPRLVTTGLEGPERVEITQGLSADERVVVRGHEGLYAGAKVSDTTAATSAPEAAGHAHQDVSGMQVPTGGTSGSSKKTGWRKTPQGGTGGLKINLSTVPTSPRVGETRLLVQVTDSAGMPVTDAKVDVTTGMQGMPGPKLTARPTKEPGLYEATVNLSMAGAWTAEVNVTSVRGGATSSKFKLEAK
jgi:multidrug efflux pump subunit AcrA (membrane-fusion protein)